MQNIDMFDICGANKLSEFAVEARAGLVNDYATSRDTVFFCSHSGGKDSQAMYIEMCKRLPEEQINVIPIHLNLYVHHDVIEYSKAAIFVKLCCYQMKH